MKSSKRMYEIVKGIALKRIAMNLDGSIGFYIPMDEVKKIFFENGFATVRKTWTRYIDEWTEYGLAEMDMERNVLWIKDPEAHLRSLVLAKKVSREVGMECKIIS